MDMRLLKENMQVQNLKKTQNLKNSGAGESEDWGVVSGAGEKPRQVNNAKITKGALEVEAPWKGLATWP